MHQREGDIILMNPESFISVSAGISGGFIGGLLLGFALKQVVKLIAVIVGLFIAGLTYLQYHQIASFNWDRIEVTFGPLTNKLIRTINDYNIETLGMLNFGIPITSIVSAGFAVGNKKIRQDKEMRLKDHSNKWAKR